MSKKDKIALVVACCVGVIASNMMSMPTEIWAYM